MRRVHALEVPWCGSQTFFEDLFVFFNFGASFFFLVFGVREHEKRVRDAIVINSDLLAPLDLNIFEKIDENP